MKLNLNKFKKTSATATVSSFAPGDEFVPRYATGDESGPTGAKARGGDGVRQPFLIETVRYMERSAATTKTANNWRLGFWAASLISLVLAVGLVYVSSQSRLVPYVVEVDSLHQAVAYKRADRMEAPSDLVLRAQIAAEVSDLRGISSDAEYEAKTVIPRVYTFLLGPAKIYADERFRGESPIVAGKDKTRRVHIDSIVRASSSSFQVDWTEETRTPHGEVTATDHLRGLFTYAMRSDVPNSAAGEEALLANPLGLYITQMSWDRTR